MGRYKEGHREKARESILEAADRKLKSCGFNGVGVDGLMKEVGQTSGAFYSNFSSKESLLGEVLARDLARLAERVRGHDLGRFVRRYLSDAHCEHPELGCSLPALSADAARAPAEIRSIYEAGLREIVSTLEASLGSRARAWELAALLVGSQVLARALPSGELRGELLESARVASRDIVK